MFISVILSDARRSAATKRESKNPENFSFIHTASGSSHNTQSSITDFGNDYGPLLIPCVTLRIPLNFVPFSASFLLLFLTALGA
jgi:hypothetical protein